ncbi:MAG: glycosyltransferase family 2 protein [Acidobacteriota bacterium]
MADEVKDSGTAPLAAAAVPSTRRTPRPAPRLLSFVIPMYNEEAVLPLLRERLDELAGTLPCQVEWVLVDDGSRDATRALLRRWADEDPRARVVELARNFGHQAALTAGMDHASGEAVVLLDADLQDPPELVREMLARYQEGYDVAVAQRTARHGESVWKRATAAAFYRLMAVAQPDLPRNASDFRLMSREVLDAVRALREHHRFLRGLVSWVGFEQVTVPFERPPRAAGKTSYSTVKMIQLAWSAALAFTIFPLRVATWFGGGVFLFGAGYAVYAFVRALFWHDLVPGWATLVILQSLIGGAILVCLGMIGEYVGRIYEETKDRPIYVVRSRPGGAPPA